MLIRAGEVISLFWICTFVAYREVRGLEEDIRSLLSKNRGRRQVAAVHCTGQADGTFFADPDDCKSYIMCAGEADYKSTCPSGLYFSPDLQTCVFDISVCKGTREDEIISNEIEGDKEVPVITDSAKPQKVIAKTVSPKNTEAATKIDELVDTFNKVLPNELILSPEDKATAVRLMEEMMPQAIQEAMTSLMHQLEDEAKMSVTIQARKAGSTRPFKLVQQFLKSKPLAKQLSLSAFILTNASLNLLADLGLKASEYVEMFQAMASPLPANPHRISADDPYPQPEPGTCPWPKYVCKDSKYRSYDGSCNNLQKPLHGRSFAPFRRDLPPQYADGQTMFRKSVTGSDLPAARKVSFTLHEDRDLPHHIHTILLMQWGQFIDHDLTLTALSKFATEPSGYGKTADIECGADGCDQTIPACKPIEIPSNDPDFFGKKCLEFVRSQGTPNLDCKIGPREQLNQVTSYMDSSQVYGSTKELAEDLRDLADKARGRMKMTSHPKNSKLKHMLPLTDKDGECEEADDSQICYHAGDERVNEQNALTVMHTIWVREHNRIEAKLHAINPQWDGERLYQETRRIVNAMMTHITYNEFLPIVLGSKNMKTYDIELLKSGHFPGYNASVDARVGNAFGAAAFRFGHTLLVPTLHRYKKGYKQRTELPISNAFFRPRNLLDEDQGGLDAFLRGMANQKIQSYDRFVTKQVSVHLFARHPPTGLGTDLISLNIQRGRDHGIPGYNQWREWCGMRRASTFEDFADTIHDEDTRRKLKELYQNVDDVDLFPAGIAEAPSDGALIGPTFGCIISRQFRRLRQGDRYWYENTGSHQFTPDQLAEIRKTKLSKVICENADDISIIHPWAMELPFREAYPTMELDKVTVANFGLDLEWFSRLWMSDYNKRINCSCIADVDINKWRQ